MEQEHNLLVLQNTTSTTQASNLTAVYTSAYYLADDNTTVSQRGVARTNQTSIKLDKNAEKYATDVSNYDKPIEEYIMPEENSYGTMTGELLEKVRYAMTY